MLRVIAFAATVAAAGPLAGTASAHPPDINDVYYGSSGYGSSYIQPHYGGTSYTQPYYGGTTYTQPYYGSTTQTQPYYGTTTHTQPYYGSTYGTSSYVSPSYTTYDATPVYTKTYTAPRRSYSGYSSPSYGYRHRGHYGRYGHYGYARDVSRTRPMPRDGHRSFGPYSDVPTTEGYNVGFAGGPTYGNDHMPVINGVRVGNNPNH